MNVSKSSSERMVSILVGWLALLSRYRQYLGLPLFSILRTRLLSFKILQGEVRYKKAWSGIRLISGTSRARGKQAMQTSKYEEQIF